MSSNLRLDRARDRRAPSPPVPSGVRLRRLGRASGATVYLVDGERVRDGIDVDFTMGGSDARYGYIPLGEVWIDRCLSKRDREATLVHELAERRLMLRRGWRYGRAHDAAAGAESRWRAVHRGRYS